ncbi:penicillin acylase [Lysobacter helvus]|uniref:Penicillin acylase n=2 Tax=Lysobacteraceae TaxID=32033 RepID=A0ABM7Q717_9GAMM|nr:MULTISPECIES: penicillin acylase family protein [Lysobacter]BCT93122.1 penicillin acylase [Lysobacter caseinilyticus]BCT96274.1 penicillin acylase [Lysobacter helvus]
MRRWILRSALALLALVVLLALTAWLLLRGSLPRLEGDVAVPGLSAPVHVARDARGVVTIEAANELDAMRALGYVHGQERFFEMDLLRRTAAGELAELFGPKAVSRDREHRVHRLRARVRADLDGILGDKRAVVQAYVDGVNAGVGALRVRPWPYLLLRQQPRSWAVEDTPLVGFAMYFDLQDASNARELAMWKLQPHLPPALFALLSHDGSSWDAPLSGASRGDAVLPTADAVSLRKLPMLASNDIPALPQPVEVGSNNFAVDGTRTRDGRAILADDMHLALRAPNIWFRAQLRWRDARVPGGQVDVGGVTLPGMPAVVAGSNRHVAWGFTNGYVDTADWAIVDARKAHRVREAIRVAGAPDVALDIDETTWGPILAHARGKALALRWAAQRPGALRMAFIDMVYARDVEDALQRADRMAIPAQNLLVVDSRDIAWRILGPLPARNASCDASRPTTTCAAWALRTDNAPRIVRPASGRLWTANSRVSDDPRLGNGGYVLGARAHQIRDDLFAHETFDERALLAIQLDDRAVMQARWWKLLRDEAARAGSPALTALAQAASHWEGRASVDSTSYRIVREWRLAVHKRLADGLLAPAQARMGAAFEMPALPQFEGVAWPLVTQRPANLLPRRYATWDALFEEAAREVRGDLASPLAKRTWGEHNTARICHPLARVLTFAKAQLCMPFEPLPGDGGMPRVQSPENGASERMVVAPGREADGILHMPGGQSGHPLSPYWGAGHEDWVHGRATPFLPGPAQHTMTLEPAR